LVFAKPVWLTTWLMISSLIMAASAVCPILLQRKAQVPYHALHLHGNPTHLPHQPKTGETSDMNPLS
jgi:hypothetical protein